MINAHVRGAVRALVWHLRENALCAYDITYAGHYEKSLLHDNDSHCYLRKIKIISSDWIALLRRLLMQVKFLILGINSSGLVVEQ